MRRFFERESFLALGRLWLLGIVGSSIVVILSLRYGLVTKIDSGILLQLRLPRAIAGIAVGGGLAVSGLVMQGTLVNPLADPFTLGIASAALCGSFVGSVIFGAGSLPSALSALLFAGCLLTLLHFILRRWAFGPNIILLIGLSLSFFFSAVNSLLLVLSEPSIMNSAVSLMFGSLARPSLQESIGLLLLSMLLSMLTVFHWKGLNLIVCGEESAVSVGLDVIGVRRKLIVIAAILTAFSVAFTGVIGFVGLLVPHLLRSIGLRNHFYLVTACFFCGGMLLTSCDLLARIMWPTMEIPVGVFTGLIGAPAFLFAALTAQKRLDPS